MGSIPREFARPGGNSIKLDPHILAGYYPPIPLIPPVGGHRRYQSLRIRRLKQLSGVENWPPPIREVICQRLMS